MSRGLSHPLLVGSLLFIVWALPIRAAAPAAAKSQFPLPLEQYQDDHLESLPAKLWSRINKEPFNLVATIIFICAIIHTFLASKFLKISHEFQHRYDELEKKTVPPEQVQSDGKQRDRLLFRAQFFHFMGEVEAVFGIWLIPLFIALIAFRGWSTMVSYVGHVNASEAIFVVVVMAIASSRPVLRLTETLIGRLAGIGGRSPTAWWLAILTFGPLLGSFITEPAAMTISALLLRNQFYILKPSEPLKYATLGLLFVNISVGGTLTHFAAPPVIMVANAWNWGLPHMLFNFGWKAAIGIVVANLIYFLIFRNELGRLSRTETKVDKAAERPIPLQITLCHILFLAWTVASSHYPNLVILGFLFFLAFVEATRRHQQNIILRPPLLVGFFLASLVIHGGCQQWWIAPVLSSLSEWPLMIGSTILTAFNDNAAITYLATLVPGFSDSLKFAVVAGAVAGGGLTVIANAPNPAGQSILASRFGPGGIAPLKLLMGAILPTIIVGAAFMLL
jgi:hypothetical protein